MMHPEFPLIKDMGPEQKRTFLFTHMRYKNERWIDSIKGEIEHYKNKRVSAYISAYGAPLVIDGNLSADLEMAVKYYEDYVVPDVNVLLSEEIPPWLVFEHPKNEEMNQFLRMLMRRDVLSGLGFTSSGRNEPIRNIPWEAKKYKDEESGKTILYFITESPNDPKVFLTRILWAPKRVGEDFIFAENLWVAESKKSAIATVETTVAWELNKVD